jgi:heme exporter protein CcmD
MKDHSFYLWMSYGVTAVALAVEIAMLRLRRSRAAQKIDEERDLEAQD